MKYFIGNWKMFGVLSSAKIAQKVNNFITSDKNRGRYKVIITPPFTLINSFSKLFKTKRIKIGAQNCFFKDPFSSNTGSVSAFMLKNAGAKYVIVGHSDNRGEGDTSEMLKAKCLAATKNDLKIIYCIGENKNQKKGGRTLSVLKKQIKDVLNKDIKKQNLIVAYEPIWSIGTGKIPQSESLNKTIIHIKKILANIFKNPPPVLYGGSIDASNVKKYKYLKTIDGFLIGGASKSAKNFIDIIKNYYR